MSRRPTLRGRLFTSHVALVTVVVAVVAFASWALTPTFFEQRLQLRAGMTNSRGQGGPAAATTQVPTEVTESYDQALLIALGVAAAIGLLVALLLAAWIARRTLGSVSAVGVGAARLAAGDYQHPVDIPPEGELADLARSINALGRDLEQTERARARLISDLAHEIRNPLATIEGYMEGLIDGVLPPSADTYATVAAEAHRLQRLTQDLSLLSRAQEGRLELELEGVDLTEIASSVVDRLTPQFEAESVSLETKLDQRLPVIADPDRLTQALTNVIGNALTHTPSGGSVRVIGRLEGPDTCVVEVDDDGEGIPADQLEAIFQRFTRLSPEGEGTGIGLNIARTIARLHGGDVRATSEGIGLGSRFTLSLPLAVGSASPVGGFTPRSDEHRDH